MIDEQGAHHKDSRRYRAIWVSDIHLGTRGCKTGFLLDFLRHTESEYLYLVGDIIDGWSLRRSWYWDQKHNDVIQKILRKARKGTQVVYVPGNHDEFAREYLGMNFGGISIEGNTVHTLLDGRRLLVTHGDEFDGVVRCAKWLAILGDLAYQSVLSINHWFNHLRRRMGYPYWSVSACLKHKVKNAVQFIDDFETMVAREAAIHKVEGVVCGHIHKAELREIDGLLYCNDGDWVESCTALVETLEGELEILHWTDASNVIALDSGDRTAAAA
ncbi:MAG: UDP-2,3-diacylglucosamine diphosphatase [Gammaproteobacteria bacterium]